MNTGNDVFAALGRLWDSCYGRDNGGAMVIQRFLLGLYNGRRFQFDLTDLRRLDMGNFEACLAMLRSEWPTPACEVHEQLAIVLNKRVLWVQFVMEGWGYDQRLPGRCKKGALDDMQARLRAAVRQ